MKYLRTWIVFWIFSISFAALSAQEAETERAWQLINGQTYNAVWDSDRNENPDMIYLRTDRKTYEVRVNDLAPTDRNYVQNKRMTQNPETEEKTEKIDELTVVLVDDLSKPGTAPGERRTLIVNGIEFGFCWCPAGTFIMGSPEDEMDRENYEAQHEVTLTKGFWLLESEVTQQFWTFVMGHSLKEELVLNRPNVGGVFEANEMKKIEQIGLGDNYPIYYISWEEANDFCRKLKTKAGLPFSLPTEAQWEYACRAGTSGPFAVQHEEKVYQNADGAEVTTLTVIDPADLAWFIDNSGSGLHPVKQKLPNPWGLYDMHGNVWEFCSDRYSKDYYDVSPTHDPTGPESGHYRINRGGSWFSHKKFCRSACRYRNAPEYRYSNLGFRIAINP